METPLPKHISEALQARRDKFIVELYNEGFNLNEISTLFNITTQRVWQIKLKNNQPKAEERA